MNLKRSLIGLGATGVAAGLIFGGSAVSTAFTSSSSGDASVTTAKTSEQGDFQTPDITLDNAIPGGDLSTPVTVSFDNLTGTTAEQLSLELGPLNGNSTLPKWIDVYVNGKPYGTFADHATATGVATLNLGRVEKGQKLFSVSVAVGLDAKADNTVQGAKISLPYTLTAQAVK